MAARPRLHGLIFRVFLPIFNFSIDDISLLSVFVLTVERWFMISFLDTMVSLQYITHMEVSTMKSIKELYKQSGMSMLPVDMSQVTFEDIVLEHEPNTGITHRYWIIADKANADENTEDMVYVDLSSIIIATSLVSDCQDKVDSCKPAIMPYMGSTFDLSEVTWDVVAECITEKMILGYSKPVPDFTDGRCSLIHAQVLHDSNYTCHYCLKNTPEDRDDKLRRWLLVDMAVTQENKDAPINLEQSILSVNGCISRPVYFNNELIMPRGAEFVHVNTPVNIPSITLLDFTGLGGITTVPFSDCDWRVRSGRLMDEIPGRGYINPGYMIDIYLPDTVDLTNRTVWLVVGHTLFFDTKVMMVRNHRTVVLAPHLLALDAILPKVAHRANHYKWNTDVVESDITIEGYFNREMWDSNHHGAFFIIINSPELYIKRQPLTRHGTTNMHVALKDTLDGFLWDKSTCSVVDYTKMDYLSLTDVYAMPDDKLKYFDGDGTLFDRIHYATDNVHEQYTRWLMERQPNMEFVSVSRGRATGA